VAERKKKLLDSHAALKFLQREKGSEAVERLLRRAAEGEVELLMGEINLGEVYYILLRGLGEADGEKAFSAFLLLPIRRIEVDFDLVRSAAQLKAQLPVSYADCFAAATALRHHASLVTGDPDFEKFEPELSVEWI
jgi:ribonuclease VapC